jgi:hypothetical protein
MKTAAFVLILYNNDSFVCSKSCNMVLCESAGLDFNSGIPVTLTDGKLTTNEVQLYLTKTEITFYTDGSFVYNKTIK